MQKIGLFEAKQKLSELVERARQGERIGITRRGKLAAVLVSAAPEGTLSDLFRDIDEIRTHAKLPEGVTVKDLIEEGRI